MSSEQPQQNPSSQPFGQARQATFNPEAAWQQKPRLRPVRGFPANMQGPDGQPLVMLGLADARQISDRMVIAPMAAQHVLPLMDGTRGIDEIVSQVGRGLTRAILEGLVAQLDDAGLLFGPTFDAILAEMRRGFDSAPNLPPAASAAFADLLVMSKLGEGATDEQKAEMGAGLIREQFDAWISEALKDQANPALDELPAGVIVPHIDYPRGWANYAAVWGRMRVVDRPDRVVILGTNHFGLGTGVTACDKGYSTPLGTSPLDSGLLEKVKAKLGPAAAEKLVANRYDHEREHSIELQIPWIQHVLAGEGGAHVPVLGVLVHDPAANSGESYDGQGLALEPFVEALRSSLEELGGKTLVVSSADLSHAGPMFGDQQPLAGEEQAAVEARNKVVQHDQEMLNLVLQVRPDDLVASMAWQQNPTRWCSTGNLVAMLKTVRPERVELLQYMAAMDPQGMGMVSSCGAVTR